ncbi:YhfC family glutamic-type intramembrane protease [Lentilactobacillus sp. TOM.63]|uniref:YhfC family intramembrane metalloprotease n=1 Tax=Lentilactobacillus sp. TOM.63 TaxID=3055077 RepID=UPI00259FEA59|nr:YhfC family glutamic-type intramembrane protease [Lentilactobacillus sp. TOM.63]MDM7516939.1 YhfC family glutamic-type intramembrane protease [Lentilactobacillus sp. TOM.63]
MVPTFDLWYMAFALILLIILPIVIFLYCRKRWQFKALPMWIGVLVFIIFSQIFEKTLNLAVLHPNPNGTMTLASAHPWLFVIYGILAAGIFEETGRLVGFLYLKKKVTGLQTAISYGIGHGGIEMILVGAMSMVNYLIISTGINAHNPKILAAIPNSLVHSLTSNTSWLISAAIIERLFALWIHLSLSVLVWIAVNHAAKFWLYPLAICLHAAVDIPAAMHQTNLISSTSVTLILTIILTILLGWFVYWYAHRMGLHFTAQKA